MKKRIIKIVLFLVVIVGMIHVEAANYEERELIPVNIETTIVTNNFSYKGFYYNKNGNDKDKKDYIVFKSIQNLDREERPISISIAFFNKNKKNIGTMNYCATESKNKVVSQELLNSKEEISYSIEVTKDYLGKDYSKDDIEYIAVLSDNKICRATGADEYIGQTVEEIGMTKNNVLDSSSELMINIFIFIGIVLIIIFLYKFMFTKSYQNFDGEDIRKGFKKLNKDLEDERQEELRRNPPKPKEIKKTKTDEVLRQEEEARKEDKSGTDLHNLYK